MASSFVAIAKSTSSASIKATPSSVPKFLICGFCLFNSPSAWLIQLGSLVLAEIPIYFNAICINVLPSPINATLPEYLSESNNQRHVAGGLSNLSFLYNIPIPVSYTHLTLPTISSV